MSIFFILYLRRYIFRVFARECQSAGTLSTVVNQAGSQRRNMKLSVNSGASRRKIFTVRENKFMRINLFRGSLSAESGDFYRAGVPHSLLINANYESSVGRIVNI